MKSCDENLEISIEILAKPKENFKILSVICLVADPLLITSDYESQDFDAERLTVLEFIRMSI